ncbi:hypothetical protein LTR37_006644 [Vermiconidia calcicola]|uniref:Uncharacterized protein n=1 Tax=Vermiconidia calcicola TaxID=1690605 RepID=A0ACC3NH67_9PEZI|nr:hypothetical protein LTR37_006644 [Vermiconidia calcicola]
MADEALKCFTSLIESVPRWIADLENILQTSTERQQEILFDNQPAQDHDQPPVDSAQDGPRKPSKSSSVISKRSQDNTCKVEALIVEEGQPTPVRAQMPHMTQSDALRLAQRKRKTASVSSGRDSGPMKYRSRSMIVVYYDGETQNRFENVVRAIGTCRNSLRKGKMSAKVDIYSQTMSGSGSVEGNKEGNVIRATRISYRSARPKQGHLLSDDRLEVFDKVDGFLEKAQAMCERAAHQVLRDGDCALEIKHAKQHFLEAQKLGEAEFPAWRMRADEVAEKLRQNEERNKVEKEDKAGPLELSSDERLVPDEDPFSSPESLEVDLEVDDSDDDDDGGEFAVKVMEMSVPVVI